MQDKITTHKIENFKGVKGDIVILRVDYNVPGVPKIDSQRFLQSIPTINFLKEKGCKIIIISHRGKKEDSLLPFIDLLKQKQINAFFCENPNVEEIKKCITENEIVLVENIRRNEMEEINDDSFAKEFASIANFYVNDAFSVSHRSHTSIVGLPKYLPSFFGFGILNEIENLSIVSENPEHPFLFISGGAKISTKVPLLKNFFDRADNIYVAGALANSFFEAQGFETGISLADNPELAQPFLGRENLHLPVDVIVTGPNGTRERLLNEVTEDENIVDVGHKSMEQIFELARAAKTILWNGPLGNYENGFDKTTNDLLSFLADVSGDVYLGGGDTLAILEKENKLEKYRFVSTGGGATLDFLAFGTLVGIKAVTKEA
jgi:phosphoglycerate kinase